MVTLFVSHSSSDKPLVDALNDLICDAFEQPVQLRYSSASVENGGIQAGVSWLDWINAQIQESLLTLLILTPLSNSRPWLMWETGAVSGLGLGRAHPIPVVPLLFGLKVGDVPSPLRDRQVKSGTADQDIWDLLESIRQQAGLTYKSPRRVQALLANYIEEVRKIGTPGTYDLFISCPMTSAEGAEVDELRSMVDLITKITAASGLKAYSALQRTQEIGEVDPEAMSAKQDLEALRTSKNYLLIYPARLVSSCLVEAGYALVSGMPSTYFVRRDDDLPYMLRGAIEGYPNVGRFRFRDIEDFERLFRRYRPEIIRN